MLNQLVIVGRLKEKPILMESEDNIQYTELLLSGPRPFKNINGEYEKDDIKCIIWNNIANTTVECCNVGDLMGINGRVQSRYIDDKLVLEIVCEKITFLKSTSDK